MGRGRRLAFVKASVPGEVDLPDHGNSYRPRRIADRKAEIRIIRSLVLTLLHIVYNFCKTWQHVIREGLNLPKLKYSGKTKELKHGGHTLERNNLKSGLRYCADCTCVAAASFP
jgi:hypothetical protein